MIVIIGLSIAAVIFLSGACFQKWLTARDWRKWSRELIDPASGISRGPDGLPHYRRPL